MPGAGEVAAEVVMTSSRLQDVLSLREKSAIRAKDRDIFDARVRRAYEPGLTIAELSRRLGKSNGSAIQIRAALKRLGIVPCFGKDLWGSL